MYQITTYLKICVCLAMFKRLLTEDPWLWTTDSKNRKHIETKLVLFGLFWIAKDILYGSSSFSFDDLATCAILVAVTKSQPSDVKWTIRVLTNGEVAEIAQLRHRWYLSSGYHLRCVVFFTTQNIKFSYKKINPDIAMLLSQGFFFRLQDTPHFLTEQNAPAHLRHLFNFRTMNCSTLMAETLLQLPESTLNSRLESIPFGELMITKVIYFPLKPKSGPPKEVLQLFLLLGVVVVIGLSILGAWLGGGGPPIASEHIFMLL